MAFNYPWTNLHELNLNWILNQIRLLSKQISKFVNLTATAHSVPYGEEPTVEVTGGTGSDPYNLDFGIPESQSSAVNTVNGQSGDVVITASDVGLGNVDNIQQYSATNPPPYPVTSVNGMTGDVIVSGGGGGGDVLSVNGKNGVVVLDKTDIGLGNVDNVQQYSATNPPPYPVTEVNGMTGSVTIGTMVDCTADLTPVADLVIDQAYCAKIGQFVIYYLRFTVNSTIGASQPMLTGLYQPIDTMTAGIDVISGSVVKFNVNSAVGRLSNQSILPTGGRAITLSYITAS